MSTAHKIAVSFDQELLLSKDKYRNIFLVRQGEMARIIDYHLKERIEGQNSKITFSPTTLQWGDDLRVDDYRMKINKKGKIIPGLMAAIDSIT